MVFPEEGPWEEEEETAYGKFEEYIEKNGVTFPEICTKRVIMRFLSANHYKIKESVNNLVEHLEWREEVRPVILNEKQKKMLDHGYLYIHGRDRCLRPLCFSQASVVNELGFDMEDSFMATWFVCFYLIDQLTVPGKVENWVFVSDLGGLSLRKIPTSTLKKFMVSAQAHMKCRIRMFFYFNVTFGLRAIWAIISPFMDKFIKHKMVLRGDAKDPALLALADPSQIEQKYGGEAENVTKFWPPYCPSEEYGVDPELLDDPKKKSSKNKLGKKSGDGSGSKNSDETE
jgi:hypothetical protein